MRKSILSVILCLTICCMAEARSPAAGDYVRVTFYPGNGPSISYEGNITDISNGLICLNCTNVVAMNGKMGASPDGINYPFDVCIGTGQVAMLVWLVPNEYNYVEEYNETELFPALA